MGKIKDLIFGKRPSIDERLLELFSDYLTIAGETGVCLNLNYAADCLTTFDKIVYFKDGHEVQKIIGPVAKGYRDAANKILYIKDTLPEPLKSITAYHEIHHAAQSRPGETQYCGIHQTANYGRMLMEAQTQYFAEKVYCLLHGVTFPERKIPTEELRMLKGGTVVSALHNYEMYDAMLTKAAMVLKYTKDDIVSVNYDFQNGMGILRMKYMMVEGERRYPYSFQEFMYMLDYIYCMDVIMYVYPEDNEFYLTGGTTGETPIHDNRSERISLERQFGYIDEFDKAYFKCIRNSGGDYKLFGKYIIKDSIRNEVLS